MAEKGAITKKRTYKARKKWTNNEEQMLVDVWEEKINQLRGQRKNTHIFAEMEDELRARGCGFCAKEIQNKIHNLTNRYRKEKAIIGKSGGSPSSWPLYFKIHSFIGGFKINNPNGLVEDSIMDDNSNSYDAAYIDEMEISLVDEEWSTSAGSDERASSSNPSLTAASGVSPVPAETPKKRFNNFQQQILNELKKNNTQISEEMKRSKEVDEQILSLQKEQIKEEQRRNNILERFVDSNEKFENAFLKVLKEKNGNNVQ